MKKIDRLQFLQLAGGILGAGVATAAAACGGGNTSAAGGPACNANAPTATIASNHGHAMTVTAADVTAGAAKTYHIMGTASHDHTVDVSGANFGDLATGKSVAVSSSPGGVDGHTHSIAIC